MTRRFTLVSYDITDDERRNRIYKTMHDFGERVQYSVFCCQLSKRERIVLKRKLNDLLNHDEDQIILLDAGPIQGPYPEPDIEYLGKKFKPTPRVQVI